MKIWHMNGAGNDFMVLDARGHSLDLQAMALRLCRRTGADGFMAVDHAEYGDFRLHFYNSDGSRGEMCGNGARCICRFAYENGIAGEAMTIQTDAGPVYGKRLDDVQYLVRLPQPAHTDLTRKPGVAYTEVGCPHAVMAYDGALWQDAPQLKEQMRALRFDPAFPKGANVSFYTWQNPGQVRILTFERGVEDFTLACGTGSGALAAVLWLQGQVSDGTLAVENRGGMLRVRIVAQRNEISELWLEGPTDVTQILDEEM